MQGDVPSNHGMPPDISFQHGANEGAGLNISSQAGTLDKPINTPLMRIWSLHPRYLDPQGLVALWRETLLAQAVLHGLTKGYTNHPQLQRFKAHAQPLDAIASYLHGVHAEATHRGYRFDASKILGPTQAAPIAVTHGQVAYEWQHLLGKLQQRNPALHAQWHTVTKPDLHPLFNAVPGEVQDWEKR
jgi:hypothetical protein